MAERRRLGFIGAGLVALAARGARADCICSGLDYTNGGSYLIDGSSDKNFVFTSEFAGKLGILRRLWHVRQVTNT